MDYTTFTDEELEARYSAYHYQYTKRAKPHIKRDYYGIAPVRLETRLQEAEMPKIRAEMDRRKQLKENENDRY